MEEKEKRAAELLERLIENELSSDFDFESKLTYQEMEQK